ncbi:MAG: endonuclease [Sphingobacteriales bacterium]|nr:MAG: endonuclease [Sphingobacteriales bacterium]
MQQVLFYLSIAVAVFTLIPLIRHDFWIFRVFEYPRLQKLVINVALIALNLVFFPENTGQTVVFGILCLNVAYLIYQVFPFTILGTKQIINARSPINKTNLSLLIANVYQDNRESESYLKLIERCNPDIVLMVETNKWWEKEMDLIGDKYPHQLKAPLENTYGMIFYSRFPLRNSSVDFLVKEDIPSIQTEVELKSGDWIKLYCLHPEPPVPQENPRSTERDKEILLVADKAKESQLPVIVMGDLNDVAWSYTTELFGKVSGLLDPRRGRGFFNSFHAKYFFLRFPLDHIFCSPDFTLSSIKRMPACGSDHFPMWVNLQLDRPAEKLNDVPEASNDDLALAKEKINAPTD